MPDTAAEQKLKKAVLKWAVEDAQASLDAGLGTAALTSPPEVLAHEITVFRDRVRVDVQISTPGLHFAGAWSRRKTVVFQGQEIYLLSKEDLISSKRAAGRPVDLEDIRLLQLPEGSDDQSGDTSNT